MTKHILIAILPLIAVLSGCATASGGSQALKTESYTTLQQKIVKGKTTKQQIEQMFGIPQLRSINEDGYEVWGYHYGIAQGNTISKASHLANVAAISTGIGSRVSSTAHTIANSIGLADDLFGGGKYEGRDIEIIFNKNSNIVKTYSVRETNHESRDGWLNQ